MLHLRSSPSAILQVTHSTTISVKTAIVRVLLRNCAGQQCRPHGAQDGFSTAWGRRSTNQFEGNGTTHRARSAQRSNMFQLFRCSTIFTFLARSSLLFTGIICNVISTVTPFFISLHGSAALVGLFMSVPQKGRYCKLAA